MDKIKDALAAIEAVIAQGPFVPTLRCLEKQPVPDWYADGKFGIFIHWGVYCVPAFDNEWYPRNMYRQGTPAYEHHLKTYGPQRDFGYHDFIPQLTAKKFDPTAWAQLFKEAGATFVVPVAEHHDGFAMYASEFNRWNAQAMGPKRDIVGELRAALAQADLVLGLSSHRAEHYWYFDGGLGFDSGIRASEVADFYGPMAPGPDQASLNDFNRDQPTEALLQDWLVRTCEFVDKYRPQLVWFDWWINNLAYRPYVKRFAAYYYNRGVEWDLPVALNYKYDVLTPQAAVFDIERGQLDSIYPCFWQNDTSVSKSSWCYTKPQDWKSPESIIADLVDVVSKNGALLLNIGPKADGTIPKEEMAILRTIGQWLSVNGEAIYATCPWTVYGEGPTTIPTGAFSDTQRATFTPADIRFTRTEDALYAIPLAQAADGAIKITHLSSHSNHSPARIDSVSLLGHGPVSWIQDEHGLTVQLPDPKQSAFPCALRIQGVL